MKRLLLALLVAGCDDAVCTSDALTRALDAAEPGDVVRVGPCAIAGSFAVPAGVTLRGAGEASVLSSVDDGAVLDTAEGARIESLRVHGDHGYYAIRGSGDLVITDTRVVVTRGPGIVLRDGTFELTRVAVEGPIDPASVPAIPPTAPSETGTVGVAVERGSASFEDVKVRGFAVAAVVIVSGELVWTDGDDASDVEATLGIGLALTGSTADLESVELGGMLAAVGRPGYALVVEGGSLEASALSIDGGEGYGIVASESEIVLASSSIANLGLAGAHVQGGWVRATDVLLRGNGGCGLAALDAREVVLERVTAAAQREEVLAAGGGRIGDGVHVRRTSATGAAIDLRATDLVLEDNERAGLLIDGLDTAPARLELVSVRAVSSGDAFGAIVQRTAVASDWDSQIVREGAAAANDAIFGGMIDPVGLLMPPAIPTSMP